MMLGTPIFKEKHTQWLSQDFYVHVPHTHFVTLPSPLEVTPMADQDFHLGCARNDQIKKSNNKL